MNTETRRIKVSGLAVDVVRKAIKNLHLGVYPPHGRVRVAAPLAVNDDAVRLAVIGKLRWIKKQREKFEAQPRQSKREMVNGESHYYMGRRYRLRVVDDAPSRKIVLRNRSTMEVHARSGDTAAQREGTLQRWYRERLKSSIPALVQKWEKILDVQVSRWGIRRMKTKWGTCNIAARGIWLNLELAKKPATCLEYIVVHEMVHLLERHHNDRFIAHLDRHLPHWRHARAILNRSPLGHESWRRR